MATKAPLVRLLAMQHAACDRHRPDVKVNEQYKCRPSIDQLTLNEAKPWPKTNNKQPNFPK